MFFQRCQVCGNRTAFFSQSHDCTPRASVVKGEDDDGVDVTQSPFHSSRMFTQSLRGEDVPVGVGIGTQGVK